MESSWNQKRSFLVQTYPFRPKRPPQKSGATVSLSGQCAVVTFCGHFDFKMIIIKYSYKPWMYWANVIAPRMWGCTGIFISHEAGWRRMNFTGYTVTPDGGRFTNVAEKRPVAYIVALLPAGWASHCLRNVGTYLCVCVWKGWGGGGQWHHMYTGTQGLQRILCTYSEYHWIHEMYTGKEFCIRSIDPWRVLRLR